MSICKTVLITGGNSGLGYQCAKALAQEPEWQIVIASRNQQRLEAAVLQLKAESGHSAITPMLLDLGSFASVRAFATQFAGQGLPPLHAIICNAGVSLRKNRQTADGIDLTFGVNHLGHYLLVHLLTKLLVTPARVVFVSSGTHIPDHYIASRMGVTPPKYTTAQNLAFPERASEAERIDLPMQRYSTSKLCNVLCAYEFARQFKAQEKEVSVFAIDPGLMPGTGLMRELPAALRAIFVPILRLASRWVDGIRDVEESGPHLARLVTDRALDGKTGLYFDGLHESPSSDDSYDRAKAIDLWNTSSHLSGLSAAESILPLQLAENG